MSQEQTLNNNGLEIQGIIIGKGRACVKKIIETSWLYRNWIFLLWCLIVVLDDAWLFYIPTVNNDKMCIELDKVLWISAGANRSLFDLFYVIHNIFRFHTGISKTARKWSWPFFLIDILIILPVPQVLLILAMVQRMRGTQFFFAMKFFLFQHVLRVIQIYKVYMKAQVPSKPAEWGLMFGFSFVQTSNVIGAIWYFFAIERESACWKKAACLNHIGCGDGSFHCDDHLGDYKFLNDFCPTKTQNSTIFDSGIFLEAFQSGILEKKDFVHKLYYCLRWGMQSVRYLRIQFFRSSFGQGLQTSTDPWENIFVVCISVSSMWLLVILVGKIQTYSQSELVRSVGMIQKGTELEQWLPYRKLSPKLQQQIQYLLYQLQETSGFDIESLINHLPKDLGREIKYELCLELLKKVGKFGKWKRALLEDLCDFVEPVTYMEHSYIVHEGDPIDKVLFVVQGNLQTYNSGNVTTASPGTDNYLKDGDICGEELVAWAQDACTRINHFSSDLPSSTGTIQSLTKVEAFVLTADDLLLFEQKRVAPFIKAARFFKLFQDIVKGIFSFSSSRAQIVTQV